MCRVASACGRFQTQSTHIRNHRQHAHKHAPPPLPHLDAAPLLQPERAERRPLVGVGESDVQRRDADLVGDRHERLCKCLDDRRPQRARRREEARAGHWGEGHARLELGVVAVVVFCLLLFVVVCCVQLFVVCSL